MSLLLIEEAKINFWLEPRTIVAYAVSLLALAEIVDLTIVSVAVPHIMGALSANLNEVTLTMTSYIVAAAVCIPLTGLVVRKFGLRNVILSSALIFGVSSVLCGMSTSLAEIIIFRLIQGVGGAFLPSVAQSYIAQKFTPAEQPKIMTVFSLCVVMGPIIGPVFGGAITEHLSWRWCFYVNVPICLLGFILIWVYLKKDTPSYVKIDYISFFFMALGVGCLEYFIDEGNSNNWFDSISMLITFMVAILLLVFFIWRALLGKSVIKIEIFKNRNFVLCSLAMFIFMLLVSASLAYFPTMLQQSFGYPVDTAGYITAPRGIIAFLVAPIIAKLMVKVDPRHIMVFGLIMFAAGCFMLSSYAPATSQIYILSSMLVQGVGMMAFFIPIMQIVFVDVAHELHNEISGVFNFFRNFAASVGTSLSATVVTQQMQVTYHDMGSHISNFARGYQYFSQSLGSMNDPVKVALAQYNVIVQGALVGYLDSFYLFAILMLGIVWLPFCLKRPPVGSPVQFE